MLAMADKKGKVDGSVPGLARRAGVELGECEAALARLRAPDAYSRTKEHEGRRIEDVDGGWMLLNHGKYRAMMSAEDKREVDRLRQREYRRKKSGPTAQERHVEAALKNGDQAEACRAEEMLGEELSPESIEAEKEEIRRQHGA